MIEPRAGVAASTPRHEADKPSLRGIVIFLVTLFASIVAALWISWGILRFVAAHQNLGAPAAPYEHVRVVPAAPLLQVAPSQDYKTYIHHERQILDSYGWVNRAQGIVRIPIQQSMNLLLRQGFPVRSASPPQNETPLKQDEVLQYTVPSGFTPPQ